MENLHSLPSVGALVQLMLVCVVVAGQLPQFNAVIEYWTVGQSETTGLQLKTKSDSGHIITQLMLPGGEGSAPTFIYVNMKKL